jgi:nucleotide-binding universal stress UspA family protein
MTPFRAVLVAADFSDTSRAAFRVACSLACETRSQVFVLHVAEPRYKLDVPAEFGGQPGLDLPVPRTPAELGELKARLRDAYVPHRPFDVEYETREGVTAEEILRYCEKRGCDLIVMGTHGRTGLRRLVAGSIAEAVLRRARCPVLALRTPELPPEAERVQVILHPTDFSSCSEPALQVARSLARDYGARLVVIHLIPSDVLVQEAVVMLENPREDLDSLETMRKRLDGPDLKFPVEVRLDHGDAMAEIPRVAGELGCGLIVMGTHGRTGLDRFLMGSVAEAVLRKAPCPVLAVKVPRPEPAATGDRPITRSVTVY